VCNLTAEDVDDRFDEAVIAEALDEVTETFVSYRLAEIMDVDPSACQDAMYSVLDELTVPQLQRAIVMLLADAAAEQTMEFLAGVRSVGEY